MYWNQSIETLPRAELEELQLTLLRDQISHARENSPYYRQILSGIEVHSLSDLRDLPFTNKQVIRERQEKKAPFGDMVAVPERDIVYISASSGSTGVPTPSPFTGQDFDEWMDVEARIFTAAGLTPDDRYCHALNFSLFVGGPCVIGAQKLGALCIHAGTIPSDRLLAILKQFEATAIWTTPSYAWYLGETALKEGIDPKKDLSIRRIFVAGEPGGSIPETRRRIEELWGADIYDFYGISDIFGACAGMCQEKNGLHIAEDHILIEVLDPDTGEPVPDGSRGEMVLTTLRKRARPLIRFRTGDIITVTKVPCACGRTHTRIMGIHGRTDDMLIIKGVNVFPSDVEAVVRDIPDLTGEYRIVVDRQNHLDVITIEVEAGVSGQEGLSDLVCKSLRARIGITAVVSILPVGTLPRETHKAKRVVDRRSHVWG
ncbi:MAG TPA: phenylacetate--CoA ligase [Methanospirillum sp.]|nr:phenylacetate--CoA ligase [Methanospirillum sp.]